MFFLPNFLDNRQVFNGNSTKQFLIMTGFWYEICKISRNVRLEIILSIHVHSQCAENTQMIFVWNILSCVCWIQWHYLEIKDSSVSLEEGWNRMFTSKIIYFFDQHRFAVSHLYVSQIAKKNQNLTKVLKIDVRAVWIKIFCCFLLFKFEKSVWFWNILKY